MARFRSVNSGVNVSVSDETAELLDSEWEPVDESAEGSLDGLKVNELKQFAADNGIDLGAATKKADILAIIQAAGNADETGDEDDDESAEGSDSDD